MNGSSSYLYKLNVYHYLLIILQNIDSKPQMLLAKWILQNV